MFFGEFRIHGCSLRTRNEQQQRLAHHVRFEIGCLVLLFFRAGEMVYLHLNYLKMLANVCFESCRFELGHVGQIMSIVYSYSSTIFIKGYCRNSEADAGAALLFAALAQDFWGHIGYENRGHLYCIQT